ncbi:MAG: cupin domain-containing protein [Nitrospira sp.]|nr:cupin domain-containing protein [Nitrospira sp.]
MKKGISHCDIENPKTCKSRNTSRLYRHKGNFTWQGIKTDKYKTEGNDWAGIIRRVLIGSHGETTRFHLRYFEITPGGYSSFEQHKHEHVVVCVRGKGKILIGKKLYTMNFLDTLYIAPHTPHQLRNVSDEPFGFFCIVNAKRDRPKLLKLRFSIFAKL